MTLYDRQLGVLPGRACDAFLRGLDALDLRGQGIPDFGRISERLQALTGWSPTTPIGEGLPRFVAWWRDFYGR